MKNNLKLFVLIAFFSLFLPHLKAEEYPPQLDTEATISMDLQEASLKDVLKIFSVQSGLNFIASEAIKDKKLTLYLENVPIKEAMEKLFKANNLAYEFDEGSGIFIVKEGVKPLVELVTKVFFLKYATVSTSSLKEEMSGQLASSTSTTSTSGGTTEGKWAKEKDAGITNIIKKVLSEQGSVIEDFRTNSLVVTDLPSRMPFIAQAIADLDIPIAQVMLEVEMLDVSKNAVDQLGVNWPKAIASLDVTGTRTTNFPFSGNKADNGKWVMEEVKTNSEGWIFKNFPSGHFTPSILTVIGAKLTLDFLRTQTDTKTLARPRLLTLDNEPAEIKITTNEVIGETVTYDTTTKAITARAAERTETGVSLRVTPQINLETGEITMFIYPSVKEASASAFGSGYRDPEERGTKSLVRVKDGETVIIGGLIRTEYSNEENKLPILSDIPFLGALFRHKNTSRNKQRELLVFITPHIVKDKNIAPAKIKKIALISQDPDFKRKAAVNTSLNGFEKMW